MIRRIGYGILGLVVAIIVGIFLLTSIPIGISAKSKLSEFPNDYNDQDGIYDENYEDMALIEPDLIFKYGSYHVSPFQYRKYEADKVVEYGKLDPTLFYSVGEVEAVNPDDTGQIDSSKYGSLGNNGTTLIGFDITLSPSDPNKTPEVNVEHILSQFRSQNARLPVDKDYYNISSPFAERIDPLNSRRAFHTGLDISAEGLDGKNIYAVLAGTVIEVGLAEDNEAGLGNYVVLKHVGFETVYGHMKDPSLYKVGDTIRAKTVLGFVGNTGRSTGPHLHFEVGVQGVRLNPEIFLKLLS